MTGALHVVPDDPTPGNNPDGPHPWDRNLTNQPVTINGITVPPDTDKSYTMFRRFLEAGPTRTLTALYRPTTDHPKGRDPSWIKEWSRRHAWWARVRAYDVWRNRAWDEQVTVTGWEVAERHVQIAKRLQGKIVQRLATLDASELSPGDLAAWLRLAVQIERDVYFPKDDTGVNVNTITQILVDPRLIPPPTSTIDDHWTIDAEPDPDPEETR